MTLENLSGILVLQRGGGGAGDVVKQIYTNRRNSLRARIPIPFPSTSCRILGSSPCHPVVPTTMFLRAPTQASICSMTVCGVVKSTTTSTPLSFSSSMRRHEDCPPSAGCPRCGHAHGRPRLPKNRSSRCLIREHIHIPSPRRKLPDPIPKRRLYADVESRRAPHLLRSQTSD